MTVSKAGQLVSAAGSGHASLVITAHEDFGVNQTIVILIKVRSSLHCFSLMIKYKGSRASESEIFNIIAF